MVHRITAEKIAVAVKDGCAKMTWADLGKIVARRKDISRLVAGPLKSMRAKVELLSELTRDVYKHRYQDIPIASALMVAFSLKYLLDMLDLMPDLVPGMDESDDPAPYQDDMAVLAHVMKATQRDIRRYSAWKKRNT
ncbi:MAG: hypothetical protein JNK21_02995 [Rhodospirillaceae bacterium]|nr:hypothetical protein [Rhodospirillaceae bacterium]